jgi:hypothetical protein
MSFRTTSTFLSQPATMVPQDKPWPLYLGVAWPVTGWLGCWEGWKRDLDIGLTTHSGILLDNG